MTLTSGCGTDHTYVAPIKPPAERLACAAVTKRPTITAEYGIDWSKVATVEQAKAEHQRYVASIRTREGVITGYIVAIEGELFACSNNAAWLRDFYSKLPDPPK